MLDENVSSIFRSKKFQAAIVAVIVAVAARAGFQLDAGMIGILISPFLVYIGGQAVADNGKEAATIQKEAAVIAANAATQVARTQANAAVEVAKEAGPVAPQVVVPPPVDAEAAK